MGGRKEVLAALLDSKKEAILRIVLHAKDEMYLKEIAEKSKVSIASTFRILQQFVGLGLLKRREWKNSKVYSCERGEKTEFLKELFTEDFDGLQEFVDRVKTVGGVESVILHGGKKKGKANVLLIGKNIDADPVEEVCKELREKGFELSYLTLTQTQYEQMSKMGLYSGEKKVLG